MKKGLVSCLLLCLALTACAARHDFAFLDQTAVDQSTGLVWAKHANLPQGQLYWKGDGNVYSFIKKLNSEKYAGYCDWRLPTRAEMEEMMAYAKGLGYESDKYETWPFRQLRRIGFFDVRDYGYWTATRESESEMWVADFASGKVAPKPDTEAYFLWPVRGGETR